MRKYMILAIATGFIFAMLPTMLAIALNSVWAFIFAFIHNVILTAFYCATIKSYTDYNEHKDTYKGKY